MFLDLMWKDLRLLRAGVIGAAIVAFVLYGVAGGTSIYSAYHAARRYNNPLDPAMIYQIMATLAFLGLALNCGFAAIFAGAGLPIERRERFADLAGMLPVSRSKQVAARLLVAACLAIVLCGGHAILVGLLDSFASSDSRNRNWMTPVSYTLAVAVGMFGLAWFGASFARSAAINVVFAIGTIAGGLLVASEIAQAMDTDLRGEAFAAVAFPTVAIVGLVATALGTVIAIRRVSP